MAHTPGPWRVHEQAKDRIIVNGSCVYRVRDMTVNEDGQYGKPRPADMALMAAAPELLAACKTALDYFNETRSGREYRDQGGEEPGLLAAAIAKAEGRGE